MLAQCIGPLRDSSGCNIVSAAWALRLSEWVFYESCSLTIRKGFVPNRPACIYIEWKVLERLPVPAVVIRTHADQPEPLLTHHGGIEQESLVCLTEHKRAKLRVA